jgi:hypothetical protein
MIKHSTLNIKRFFLELFMKQKYIFLILVSFLLNPLHAQMTVSGILDSTVSMSAGAGDAPDFSIGLEEYANIRFQSRLRDKAVVYGAVNLLAAAGEYASNAAIIAAYSSWSSQGLSPTAYVAGENYIAGIELERLYFRLNGETVSFDGGLMRLPFGYGQVWGSSDFLNPKNPLKPDARARAILGTGLFWYPNDALKLLAFGAAPRDPFLQDGKGWLLGLSVDQHWDKASIQALYSYETPKELSDNGIHRSGFSAKFDFFAGFVFDMLYTYNHEAKTKIDGLSLSAGADYSFFDGNLIVMAEYLYNGETSSTASGFGGSFSNNHYLYTGITWRFNDFTNISAALISGFDDISFTPVVSFNHELFQGATLTFNAQIPMDRDLFNKDGNCGEFGPMPSGYYGRYFNCTTRLRLRF